MPKPTSGSTTTGASHLIKRSMVLNGHPTSVALEEAFWAALADWAAEEGRPVSELVAAIDEQRPAGSLASAIRVAVLLRARKG